MLELLDADPLGATLAVGGAKLEATLLKVLLQLTVIVIAARIGANVARRVGQPMVVGEIVAGLLMGPSALGAVSRFLATGTTLTGGLDVAAYVFDPSVSDFFQLLAQLGLVLLLFVIGLEFDFGHLRGQGAGAAGISITGVVLPFVLGLGTAWLMFPHMGPNRFGAEPDFTAFALFVATALCITAIPILGRIMMELGLTRTRVGTLTISAAAFDDAIGWILLATVGGMVRAREASAEFDPATTLSMIAGTVAFALCTLLVLRPLLSWWAVRALAANGGELSATGLAVLLSAVFVCAMITNLIGIFSIFGAFFLGACLSDVPGLRESVSRALERVLTALLLPVFFTYTGLRTDVGSLESPLLWGLCGLVLVSAFAGKLGGCTLAARAAGLGWRESACVGVMMNTRALMELIVINEGYNLGVLTAPSFCMLVIMAIATTIVTTPMMLRLIRGSELESAVAASGFLDRK